MDIFQRTCFKEGFIFGDLREDEIEITSSGSLQPPEEEEEKESEEQLDLNVLKKELECMKRRIQRLQLKLKVMMNECPEEECVDPEVELTCSENKEICALQKGHYKLQCQINELIKCCKFAKEQIKDLRMRMCEKAHEVLELQKKVDLLSSWRNTLQHEFGVCLERFEYLKHVKAEWKDVEVKLEDQNALFSKMIQRFVPKQCFVKEKKYFLTEIEDLHKLFQEWFDEQLDRFVNVEKRLDKCCGEPKKEEADAKNPNIVDHAVENLGLDEHDIKTVKIK